MRLKLYGKKGNFGIMTQAAIAVGVFFFVIAIVVLLLAKVGENSSINPVYGDSNTSINGESVTLLNSTAVSVAHTLVNTGSWAVYNGSNYLGLGNFTFNNVSGTINLSSDATIDYNNTAVSVNYTYDNSGNLLSGDTNASAAVNDGKEALNNMSDLGGILVYVLFLVIVLGLFTLVGYGAYKYMK